MYSVSKVLGLYFDANPIPKAVLEQAIERGNETHRCCTLFAQGKMAIPKLPGVENRLEAFKKWWKLHDLELIDAEPFIKDEAYGFYGHPDLVCLYHESELWVPDMKTPMVESPTWKGQVSAYVHLVRQAYHCDIVQGCAVQLPDEEKQEAKVTWYDEQARDLAVFLGLVQACREYWPKGGVQFD
jgi:hypothetical protein